MMHQISFEAIETYIYESVCPSEIMGDKSKKANFRKAFKAFSILHGHNV